VLNALIVCAAINFFLRNSCQTVIAHDCGLDNPANDLSSICRQIVRSGLFERSSPITF
jgi:hypothetical protein